jgi:uncharacterized protein (DUF1501 family)
LNTRHAHLSSGIPNEFDRHEHPSAQSPASDDKALVCIFLFGGNDADNMLVPFDTDGFSNDASLRGPLDLPQGQLLQLAAMPNFGLHGSLPELRGLVNSGAAALLANVGTLVQPTTRDDVAAQRNLPSKSIQPRRSTVAVAERGTDRRHRHRLGRPDERSAG